MEKNKKNELSEKEKKALLDLLQSKTNKAEENSKSFDELDKKLYKTITVLDKDFETVEDFKNFIQTNGGAQNFDAVSCLGNLPKEKEKYEKLANIIKESGEKVSLVYNIIGVGTEEECAALREFDTFCKSSGVDGKIAVFSENATFYDAKNAEYFSQQEFDFARKELKDFAKDVNSCTKKDKNTGEDVKLSVAERYAITKSRNWVDAVSRGNDKLVCAGFAELLKTTCDQVFDKNELKCFVQKCDIEKYNDGARISSNSHANCLVFIKDEEYGLNGVYYNDPTWDCIKDKNADARYFKGRDDIKSTFHWFLRPLSKVTSEMEKPTRNIVGDENLSTKKIKVNEGLLGAYGEKAGRGYADAPAGFYGDFYDFFGVKELGMSKEEFLKMVDESDYDDFSKMIVDAATTPYFSQEEVDNLIIFRAMKSWGQNKHKSDEYIGPIKDPVRFALDVADKMGRPKSLKYKVDMLLDIDDVELDEYEANFKNTEEVKVKVKAMRAIKERHKKAAIKKDAEAVSALEHE